MTVEPGDEGLAALRRWRTGIARTSAVAPEFVLTDQALADLTWMRPVTTEDLAAIIGPIKAARYGPKLLTLLRH